MLFCLDFDSGGGLTMMKLKGLTLGSKSGKAFDKAAQRPGGGMKGSSLVMGNANKSRRAKKPPGSLLDMSNDGGDALGGTLGAGGNEFLSDNDDPMKDDDEEEGSSNFMQDDSDN